MKKQQNQSKQTKCIVCGRKASDGHKECNACFKQSHQKPAEQLTIHDATGISEAKAYKYLGY